MKINRRVKRLIVKRVIKDIYLNEKSNKLIKKIKRNHFRKQFSPEIKVLKPKLSKKAFEITDFDVYNETGLFESQFLEIFDIIKDKLLEKKKRKKKNSDL